MGCCISTPKKPTPGNPKRQLPPPTTPLPVSKSPPRAEDEAVKEVLSETPLVPTNPDPDPPPNPNPYYYTPIPKINHPNPFPTAPTRRTSSPRKPPPSLLSEITKLPPPDPSPISPAVTPDEISEVSEISCLSETVSTAELRASRSPGRARAHKPVSDPVALRGERLTGKSPVRRPDPSPRRRDPGQAVVRNRVASGPLAGKREPGENSRRRSRSPVVSRSNVGRSPSGRKAGLSPARARMVQPDAGDGNGCERKTEENEWDQNPTVPSESLENPLVSLECFIFL